MKHPRLLRPLPRTRLRALSVLTASAVAIGVVGVAATPLAAAQGPTTLVTTVNGKQLETLDRGVISVRSGSANLVSWRLLASDPAGTSFSVYRAGTKITSSPVTASTNYLDAGAVAGSVYTVRAVVNGTEQAASGNSLNFANGYLDVPISPPSSIYSANDASVGDLDGDGQYEIVLKWDPSDSKDNSQSGITSNVYVDAY